jgi:hypothetical protein
MSRDAVRSNVIGKNRLLINQTSTGASPYSQARRSSTWSIARPAIECPFGIVT